tara:strand:+ start:2059 stop:2235 length:177 start_codon:yes stop_codon:yes gene_type:complete
MEVSEEEIRQVSSDIGIEGESLLLEEIERIQEKISDSHLTDRVIEMIENHVIYEIDNR